MRRAQQPAPPPPRQVLGALASVMTVWLVTGILLFEAVQRIITPEHVDGRRELRGTGGVAVYLAGQGWFPECDCLHGDLDFSVIPCLTDWLRVFLGLHSEGQRRVSALSCQAGSSCLRAHPPLPTRALAAYRCSHVHYRGGWRVRERGHAGHPG